MFHLFGCCGKKSTKVVPFVAEKSKESSTPQKSVPVFVPDCPAPKVKNDTTSSWLCRLFGRPVEKTRVVPLDVKTGEPKQKPKPKKPHWWQKKRRRKTQTPEETVLKKQRPYSAHQDKVVDVKGGKDKKTVPKKEARDVISVPKTLRHQQLKCLGFPNPAQICYMNSCLQSLLTLEDFVRAISCQEKVWSSVPDAEIMRSFMDISRSQFSSDAILKSQLLFKFKNAVSAWNPEFEDLMQKDAHEFFTSVLHQMRFLGTQLKNVPTNYSCPVEDHMLFKMLNIRTCKSCGAESTKEEEYTNLSLNISRGGCTVEQMLEDYLEETELDFKCKCGCSTSSNRVSFMSLPRVLVLHLKRFRFTSTFQLKKVHDRVKLIRDLVVSSNQGCACYSLVSVISHISPTANFGHYVSDGVDLDVGQVDLNDRWFTYNDAMVTETTGESVCVTRRRSSYILFYKRHD